MTIQDKRDNLKLASERLKEASNRDMKLDEIVPTMIECETLKGIVDYWTDDIARTGERS